MSASAGPDNKTVVLYDGGCGLCRGEIAHYARLDRDNRLEWVDLNTDHALLSALGVSRDQAMRRMHAIDADGVLRDGVCAFLAVWQALPYYRRLPGLIHALRLVPLLELGYRRFAGWRYRRRRRPAVCPTP